MVWYLSWGIFLFPESHLFEGLGEEAMAKRIHDRDVEWLEEADGNLPLTSKLLYLLSGSMDRAPGTVRLSWQNPLIYAQ